MKVAFTLFLTLACAGISAEGNGFRAQDKSIPAPAAARDYSQKYFHSFKGDVAKKDYYFVGPDANECVKFEPDGLRITLPAGRTPQTNGTGVCTSFAVRGDFEITVSFDILTEPKPADSGTQTKVTLRATLDRPGSNMVTLHRRVIPNRGAQFFTWQTLVNETSGENEQKMGFLPTAARTGRLRLVRTASNIATYVAEGADGAFTLLKEYPLAPEDLKNVAIVASTGGPQAALDVRFTDLLIRSESLRDVSGSTGPPLTAAKGGLAGGLLIGVIIILLLALGLWLVIRQRHG